MRKALCLFACLLLTVQAEAKVLKIATISPEGSGWMKAMRAAAKTIETETAGRVKLKFYPGGVMGNDAAVLKKIRIRQLHGAAVPAGSLRKFYNDVEIYSLPLRFKNFEEVDYVRSKMDDKIVAGIEEGGFVTFGLGEGGLAYAMSNTAINTVQELKQKKVWIPSNDQSALQAVQAFDISPFPLDISNVLVSLQTGMVDTVATSPIAAIALQWHTQVKTITDLPLIYFYAVLAIDKKTFSKLKAEDQAIMRDVLGKTFKEIDAQNRKDNIAAFQALTAQGIKLNKPSAEQAAAWYERADKAVEKIADEGIVSKEALQELSKHLQDFRAQQAQ
jgi:TRAP-type C4-dicarboxylate transport system substrate-binding protein